MAIATINPATGEVVKSFEPLTGAQIEQKLQLAASAFRTHRRTSFADRASKMRRAAEILEKEKDECAHLMTLEMGKPLKAAVAEALKCATGCRYYAENAEKFLADEIVETGAKRSFIRYLPIGPILAIMPWNFPFWQVFRFVAPALMAGNVGLLKHASNVPQCALKIEDILRRAGFAEGVFQTLLIGSAPVDGILNDPRVVAATLTGSEQAGIQVGVSAAKRIKKVVLMRRSQRPSTRGFRTTVSRASRPSALSWRKKLPTSLNANSSNACRSCVWVIRSRRARNSVRWPARTRLLLLMPM